MKKAIRISLLILCAVTFSGLYAMCQDTTAVKPIGGFISKVPTWVWGGVYGLYELIARNVPTVKNYSPLSWVIKIIQLIAPNNKDANGATVKNGLEK